MFSKDSLPYYHSSQKVGNKRKKLNVTHSPLYVTPTGKCKITQLKKGLYKPRKKFQFLNCSRTQKLLQNFSFLRNFRLGSSELAICKVLVKCTIWVQISALLTLFYHEKNVKNPFLRIEYNKQGKFPWKFTIIAISLLEGLIVDLTKKYFGKCLKSYPWKETFLRCVLHLLLNQKNFSLLSAFGNVTFIKKGTPFLAYNCSFIFDFHIAKKVFFKVSMHNFCHCLVSQKKTIKYLKIACLSDFTKNCWKLFHTHSQTISEVLNVGP